MSELIPNNIYKRAAAICDQFPIIDFPTIAEILYADQIIRESPASGLLLDANSVPNHDLKPSLDPKYIPTEKQRERKGRKQPVRAKIDGEMFIATSRKNLCAQIGIEKEYDQLFHGGLRAKSIHDEADSLAKTIHNKFGSELTEYYCYGFDGKFYCAFVKDCICERIEEVKA